MSETEHGRQVLVTGAGSGLGQAIAGRLAESGDRVLGTVRDPARARALTDAASARGLALEYAALELGSGADVARLAERVVAGGGLDVLIHNAGFGVFGSVEEVDADLVARQFAVNLFGPLDLTRRLLPGLRARRGHIVWIGSLAGRIALPFQAHYSATKAAIASISDALRLELAPHGVRVTCVEPGDFATGFSDARTVSRGASSPYGEALDRCLAAVNTQERGGPDPSRVGRLVEALTRSANPPARRPVGEGARAMCLLLRLLPDRIREAVVRRHYRQTRA